MNKYLVKDIIRFSVLAIILIGILVGAYVYDRSTDYFQDVATSVYGALID